VITRTIKHQTLWLAASLAVCLAAAACGGESDSSEGNAGTGGTAGTGGVAGAAGTAGTGGAAGTAGTAGTGGAAGTSGTGGFAAGGPCEYDDIPGTATITTVEPDTDPTPNSCANEPTIVRYSFAPDDPSIPPEDYDVTQFGFNEEAFHTIYTPGGSPMIPPKSCLEPTGFVVDAEFDVVRSVITQGTCTPVMDAFTDVDWSVCEAECE